MTTKLVQHGDQLAVLLDPEFLQEAGINLETPVEVTADEHGVHITVRKETHPSLSNSISWVHQNYSRTLKRLAE